MNIIASADISEKSMHSEVDNGEAMTGRKLLVCQRIRVPSLRLCKI